ncbi:hypothetical protein E2C01_089707 [Portunus trituberculatus]|uniref:Uncharacterized protein n=1 Tax=Portunus trituberculatus TaxID=210409 RepID=A0A5B7JQB4_PORTR|nr:hypothetical protein [Portunus trituberculatus]
MRVFKGVFFVCGSSGRLIIFMHYEQPHTMTSNTRNNNTP